MSCLGTPRCHGYGHRHEHVPACPEAITGVKRVREKEGHIHTPRLYNATAKGASGIMDGFPIVVCAYCHRWWCSLTTDVLREGNNTCEKRHSTPTRRDDK